ncbi:flippase-like domain-containing protein, partial [Candidatus Bathyarchaeota archaeon]|nr:flippase-like domain-containing protein [Candidatus Bathyarchaeota archaeon]
MGSNLGNKRIRIFFFFVGILIFLIYLIYTNPFKILFEVGRFNAKIFAFAVILNYLGLLSLALSWFILLRVLDVEIGFWKTVQITFASMFVVWIFPIPSGVEVIRAYLVRNKSRSNIGKAVSSVILNKVYYFIAFGVLIT